MVRENLRILLLSLLILLGARALQKQWESHVEGLAEVDPANFIFSQRAGGAWIAIASVIASVALLVFITSAHHPKPKSCS